MTNLPLTGIFNVTCEYGRKGKKWACGHHTGIDLTCNSSDNIYSSCNGTVTRVDYDKSYGNFVTVKEETTGKYHWFCHLKSTKCQVGQKVTRATILGIMGATGNATGKHLHFEIRNTSNKYGDEINPCDWLGIENKVQRGLNSNNYEINTNKVETNNSNALKVGTIKKFAVRTNVREQPNLEGKAHLFLPNTTVEIMETSVNNEDGYIWDKVRIVYAGANDIKQGYVARTNTRYQ